MKLYSVMLPGGDNFIGSKRECLHAGGSRLHVVRSEHVAMCECEHSSKTAAKYIRHGKCLLCGGNLPGGMLLEFMVMLACVVLILLVILPWFGGSDYPNISDFIGLLGDIVKVIV